MFIYLSQLAIAAPTMLNATDAPETQDHEHHPAEQLSPDQIIKEFSNG